jgi:hypothetical protein
MDNGITRAADTRMVKERIDSQSNKYAPRGGGAKPENSFRPAQSPGSRSVAQSHSKLCGAKPQRDVGVESKV